MRNVTLEELLEAGCHFGHQVTRQNPKAAPIIFEARDGIHIIDLEETKKGLEEAGAFIRDVAKNGGNLLVLATKKQAESVLKEEKARMEAAGIGGMYFVTRRWIGGTLTNFAEVSKNFRKLKDLSSKLHDSSMKSKYTKKELLDWDKERQKLHGFYGGIEDMQKLPDALFIIDTHLEHLAVAESMKMRIKTVGITDTNSDPNIIDYPIPANDDAVGSLKLIISYIFDAWMEGKKKGELELKASEEKKALEEQSKAAEEKEKKADVVEKVEEKKKVTKTAIKKDATMEKK